MTDATTSRGRRNDLTDVAGLRVGHHQRVGRGWRTGTTVVICPPGTTGGCDVRGGAPGTRETDLLAPHNMVEHVDAVCLSGGSAYGLAAADGVLRVLERAGRGVPVGADRAHVVPIVPTAVIFDLGRGGVFGHRPDAGFGERAATRAQRGRRPVALGSVGAGAGAVAGGLCGGVGTASAELDAGGVVAALVVVNPAGAVVDPDTGLPFDAAALTSDDARLRRPPAAEIRQGARVVSELRQRRPADLHTTIGVVATDLALTKAECQRVAGAAHDGLARAVRPSHGMTDGDTFFAVATGERVLTVTEASLCGAPGSRAGAVDRVLVAAADVVSRAITRAVLHASGWPDRPAYAEVYPSAVVGLPGRPAVGAPTARR